jgi:uncharacterized protein YjbJ (UPF0337 family)
MFRESLLGVRPRRFFLRAGNVNQPSQAKGDTIMGGKTDIVKGRIEEAAGALFGSDKLREKGKTDQVVGRAKQAAQKNVDQARSAAQRIVAEAKTAARKAVHEAHDVAQQAIDKAKGVT